jgi:hypothetical protein
MIATECDPVEPALAYAVNNFGGRASRRDVLYFH